MTVTTIWLALLSRAVLSQTLLTYTGCHQHDSTDFCFGPDGSETAVWTYMNVETPLPTLPASVAATTTTAIQTTAIINCYAHGSGVYCTNGSGVQVSISLASNPTEESPAQYTGCHSHGGEQLCVDAEGRDVPIVEGNAGSDNSHSHEEPHREKVEMDCHFHAGVEHCVPVGQPNSTSSGVNEASTYSTAQSSCAARDRDYDVPLRIGTLFVIFVTSSIGVFAPMFLHKLPSAKLNDTIFTMIKQFGTGIIISTAFVHLYTHAYLMFTNPCLGRLEYEATTSAIVMAGIFIAWLIEYGSHRLVLAKASKSLAIASGGNSFAASDKHSSINGNRTTVLADLGHNHGPSLDPADPHSRTSVLVMEAGILFHSILIGLTLVVAGDSFYKTLLVVIVFHQFFEGLALGARISVLPGGIWAPKFFMGVAFAVITPLGMTIGLGVLRQFNGNDEATIVTIGTLDAVSAGILIWVGVVDMWARDWIIEGGEMIGANLVKMLTGLTSLLAGLVLMSLLGKWV